MFCVEIALFFRDIFAKILKNKDVAILKENIAVKLCNLEKIFTPSFFDVMEHLVVQCNIDDPVQYRWIYPFERYIYHVKKKIKIRNILQVPLFPNVLLWRFLELLHITLENPEVPATVLQPGDIRFTYHDPDVLNMFYHEGRVSGKIYQRHLTDDDYTVLQTFLILNCPAF